MNPKSGPCNSVPFTGLTNYYLPNLILLADHNSVLVPGRDTYLPPNPKELPNIVRAREVETETLATLGLAEAWTEIHEDRDTGSASEARRGASHHRGTTQT